jgi:NADH dehydrogenase
MTDLAHIVIVGCGFGGLEATKALHRAPVRITLIDRTNHHLFQPLLYQVATAGLSAPAIAAPIRHLFRNQPNVAVLMGEVISIDANAKQVHLADGRRFAFDHLIVAAGVTHSYFGHDGWAAAAPGLKTLEDAFMLRRRLLLAYEQAELESDAAKRQALLTSVVIGAGPTGVEMAGTMAEIARHTLPREFRHIDLSTSRVLLVEGGSRVLPSFDEQLSASALAQLQRLGVDVQLNSRVVAVEDGRVTMEHDGMSRVVNAGCVVWAAGVQASPLGKALAVSTHCALDRAGRVIVEPDLSVPGHATISVIGDLAAANSVVRSDSPPQPVPGVSAAAKQMGRAAAANILRRMRGQATRPFRYADYGSLATIGRNAAVADVEFPLLGRVKWSGYLAWLFWLFIHIYFLIGFRNRLVVMLDWAWAYLSFERHARIVAEPAASNTVRSDDKRTQ